MDRDEDNDMVRQGTHIELQSLEPEVTTCPEREASSNNLQVSLPLRTYKVKTCHLSLFFPLK